MLTKNIARIMLFVLAVFAPMAAVGQPKPFMMKSPRPSSFETVLPGISSYNFTIEDKENADFIEAYFFEEFKKWIEAIRPGILFGIDYRKPSPEHLSIGYRFHCKNWWAANGICWLIVSNIKVQFTIAGIDYEYVFSIPDFMVQSNNFGDHSLYNNLLESVNNHIYNFDKSKTLHLASYWSGYTETNLKEEWEKEGCRLFEGIYEDLASDNGHKNNKYKLALKYIDDKPCLIYLEGAWLFKDWKEGEYKAWLEPTATTNIFKAQWLMANKDMSSAYISFDKGAMVASISSSNENSTYIKLFPSVSDNISPAEAKSNNWTGTGFALKNGYIVTNFHVVDGAKSIEVHGVNGNSDSVFSASVVATDKNNDLAIIKLTDSGFTGFGNIPYSIKNQMVDVGETVWVMGYPLTQYLGNEIKLTNGVISSKSGYQGDVSTYQITAPVQPGNSGGPLFDSKGNIIGIVNAGVPGAENVGYAIKTSYLKNLADSYSLSSYLPTANTISSIGLKGQVKSVKNFIFLLMCSSKAPSSASTISSSSASTSTEMSISKSYLSLVVGETEKLYAYNFGSSIEWQSNNPDIATVSGDGIVRAIAPGTTSIWAKGIEYKRCQVTVLGSSRNDSSGTSSSSPKQTSSSQETTSNSAPKMVDLGLSVKWADRNVGAASDSGVGEFYSWGETDTKSEFTQENYKWFKENTYANPEGMLDISGSIYDPSRTDIGSSWRMPTEAELEELICNCKWTWETVNGVQGYRISGKNGNSIFLPANGKNTQSNTLCGRYWTSETSPWVNNLAYCLDFDSKKFSCSDGAKFSWAGIRPVTGKQISQKSLHKKADEAFAVANTRYLQGDYTGALESVEASIQLKSSGHAHYLRGYLALNQFKDSDKAKSSFLYCVNTEYRLNESQWLLANAYSLGGDYEEAIRQFDKFLKIHTAKDVTYLNALFWKAHCKSELNQWTECITDYEKILEYEDIVKWDSYAIVYNNIAWAYLNLNHVDKAVEPIEKAIKLNHTTSFIWDTDGEVKYKTGQYKECLVSMTNAVTINKINGEGEHANAYYYRGLAKIRLGNVAGGYTDLEKAADLGESKATDELKKINVSTIDFSTDGSFNREIAREIISTSAGEDCKIIQINMSEESTIIYFQFTNTKYEDGGWYSISPDAYIRDKSTGKKYFLLTAQNCSLSPYSTGIKKDETKTFSLVFPALPNGANYIDFVESEDSTWH